MLTKNFSIQRQRKQCISRQKNNQNRILDKNAKMIIHKIHLKKHQSNCFQSPNFSCDCQDRMLWFSCCQLGFMVYNDECNLARVPKPPRQPRVGEKGYVTWRGAPSSFTTLSRLCLPLQTKMVAVPLMHVWSGKPHGKIEDCRQAIKTLTGPESFHKKEDWGWFRTPPLTVHTLKP